MKPTSQKGMKKVSYDTSPSKLRYLGNYPKILCQLSYVAGRTPSCAAVGWRQFASLNLLEQAALGMFPVAKDFVGANIVGKDGEEQRVFAVFAEESAT